MKEFCLAVASARPGFQISQRMSQFFLNSVSSRELKPPAGLYICFKSTLRSQLAVTNCLDFDAPDFGGCLGSTCNQPQRLKATFLSSTTTNMSDSGERRSARKLLKLFAVLILPRSLALLRDPQGRPAHVFLYVL